MTPNPTYSDVLHTQQDSYNQCYPFILSEFLESVTQALLM